MQLHLTWCTTCTTKYFIFESVSLSNILSLSLYLSLSLGLSRLLQHLSVLTSCSFPCDTLFILRLKMWLEDFYVLCDSRFFTIIIISIKLCNSLWMHPGQVKIESIWMKDWNWVKLKPSNQTFKAKPLVHVYIASVMAVEERFYFLVKFNEWERLRHHKHFYKVKESKIIFRDDTVRDKWQIRDWLSL